MKFKIGDLVKGLDKGMEYGITDMDMTLGEVVRIDPDEEEFAVKVLKHTSRPKEIGNVYGELKEEFFKIVKNKSNEARVTFLGDMKIIHKPPMTIVKQDGFEGRVSCYHTEAYDEFTGFVEAYRVLLENKWGK